MYKKLIGSFLSFLGLVVACESVHEIKLPTLPPRLVMNMVYNQDSLLKVNLSRTIQDLGNYYYTQDSSYFDSFFIDNAKITWWINEKEAGELQKTEGRGNYTGSGNSLSAGDRITFQAEVAGYQPVKGETFIPYPSPVLEVDTQSIKSSVEWDRKDYWDIKLDIRFQDQPNVRNYYMISFRNRIDYTYYGEPISYYWMKADIYHEEDLLFEHEGYFRFSQDMYISYNQWNPTYSFLFTDETIDGKETLLNFHIKNTEASFSSDTLSLENRWTIEFYNLSESYYLYFRSKALQYDQTDFFWDLGLREPMPTYTNVKGGYGLVSALQKEIFDFTTPETDKVPPLYEEDY